MSLVLSTITEAEFTRMVLQLARLRGWWSFHARPARTKRGWRTAVQGDGTGFPDVLLLRGPVQLVAELKVRGRPTEAQRAWLAAFAAAGVPAYTWTPADWSSIEAVLR
jgi:hypothetical protein